MIAYDRLSQIIPNDMALANKALQVSLQQISGITNLTLPTLANTVSQMQLLAATCPILGQQKTPISGDTRAYYLNVLGAYGTGVCNTILTVDMLGTAAGTVVDTALANTVVTLGTMNTTYLQSCYQTMLNLINGDYTTGIDPLDPTTYQIDIPSGTPGAGSYGPYTSTSEAYNDVMLTVLIPITQTELSNLVATYPTQCATMTNNFDAICQQMGNEQDLQVRSGLDWSNYFANLQANNQSSTMSFIFSLPGYGQDTIEGGSAQFLQTISDYNPITGNITINQDLITGIPSFLGVTVGATISGANIPSGTVVNSFTLGPPISQYELAPGNLTMSLPANTTTQMANLVVGNVGGQAIIGVMVQGRNQTALNSAGILTNNNVPLSYPIQPPQANLIL